ncbi:MAG: MBL fold metallo-hydrolase [candidate division KSB1 bacterium]
MAAFVRSLQLGKAKVSIINIGDIYLPLAEYMNVPKTELAIRDDLRELAEQTRIPIHCIFFQLSQTSVLVDAGVYEVKTEPEYAIPDYEPPPSLVDRLIELGIQPEKVEHVVITHRHWDHFNGTTCDDGGEYVPQFPNARYYLGRADWERAATALQDPQSFEYRTLRVLHNHGMLELIDGNRDLGHGVQILAAPGETPGHQIVRVHSDGETFYCLGDMYHHPVEFAHPEWMVSWAASETNLVSRQALLKTAINERALLLAAHIPAIGRLQAISSGIAWENVL